MARGLWHAVAADGRHGTEKWLAKIGGETRKNRKKRHERSDSAQNSSKRTPLVDGLHRKAQPVQWRRPTSGRGRARVVSQRNVNSASASGVSGWMRMPMAKIGRGAGRTTVVMQGADGQRRKWERGTVTAEQR